MLRHYFVDVRMNIYNTHTHTHIESEREWEREREREKERERDLLYNVSSSLWGLLNVRIS